MKAVAIDCAVSRLGIAVQNGALRAKAVLDIGTRQSEKLLPAIDALLGTVALDPKDLDCTVVTLGPGSFTGLRLGLSVAKALNLAHGIPVYGIPSLEAFAWPYRTARGQVLSVIESKEDEFFFAVYQHGECLRGADDRPVQEVLGAFSEEQDVIVCGPGAAHLVEYAREHAPLLRLTAYLPQQDAAESLLELAVDGTERAPLADYDGPLYVRKSEAEIVRERREAGGKS